MNLISITNRAYLLFFFLAFLVGGGMSFFLLQHLLYEEIDESLWMKREQIRGELQAGSSDISTYSQNQESSLEILQEKGDTTSQWKDISIYDKREDEMIPFRELTSSFLIKGKFYRLILRKSLIETEDLIEVIVLSFSVLIMLLIISMLIVNRWVVRRIWTPFFQTLKELANYRLTDPKPVQLPDAKITEFQKLNQAINALTTRNQRDYETLKRFTENASHEIQTPLAAVKSNLDLLIQSQDLTESQASFVRSILKSVNKLSKLNEGLLLLTKMENQQFPVSEKVDMTKMLLSRIERFQDLFEDSAIQCLISPNTTFLIAGASDLVEILLDNLLNNAIQYNSDKSPISVFANEQQIRISNSGKPFSIDPQTLFQRFVKEDQSSGSLGLGLAISQQICQIHGLILDYSYEADQHHFTIRQMNTEPE